MSFYESVAKAVPFERSSENTFRVLPTEIDPDGEGEFVTAYPEMPNGDRGEIELFITHHSSGAHHSHWDRLHPKACPKLNGDYVNFDNFLAAYSGTNDSEVGNRKLDESLIEPIKASWDRWAAEMNSRAAEDEYDQKEAARNFWWTKGL